MDKESFQARKEIARRKVDQALWVKAMSQSKGDKNEAKIRYVRPLDHRSDLYFDAWRRTL